MRVHLIAPEPAAAAAQRLRARLADVLSPADQCALRASGDEPDDAGAPDMAVVLVEAGQHDAARQVCARIAARAPGCVLLAAGEEGVHADLDGFLRCGAVDLLFLPIGQAELRARVAHASGRHLPCAPGAAPAPDPRLDKLIGRSNAFRGLLERIPALAACDADVLVIGETGTGKELVAQALHYMSSRASMPWVPVNCGAIPNDLVESELFGHARGAYTGAHATGVGLVEEAEKGTLFLDDVDCLPLVTQAKLLRLLQEREYRPVGSSKLRHADIRLVAASNRELSRQVAQGAFRADLFYRLNVMTLVLPPLRERRDDIPLLAMHFLRQGERRFGKPGLGIAAHALHKLMRHDWPGNVRELQHTVERALVHCSGGLIHAADIQFNGDGPPEPDDVSFQRAKARVVERFERDYIEQMLARCNGNIALAARESGKHRRAFFELIRKHRIESDVYRDAL
jgi:two-component system response regulator GlrR